jgi:predicted negative regulator of RcsB-dependent stress response
MSVKKHEVQDKDHNQVVVDRAKDFWTRYNKPVMVICVIVIIAAAGWIGYMKFYKEPQDKKAADAMFQAESYFKNALLSSKPDSLLNLALNGDGRNSGFLKIISKYGGTDQSNLAKFYAGNSYILLGDNAKAIKYLKDFSTDSKVIQARAYKLLGDAYADTGNNSEALKYYKKAAEHFTDDTQNSSEYLFLAAYLADRVMNDPKTAVSLYKELKEKYPSTQKGIESDKYLARLGVYNAD